MTWRKVLTVLRRSILRRSQDERDLDDEIQFHLAQEAHLRAERGASADNARRLDTIGPAITRALQQTDARTPVAYLRAWDAQLYSATWPIRVLTMLLVLFAGGSLFIAAIGQYAVVSFDMRRRVRELGLRMALGASSRQVLARVLSEGFTLTVTGLVTGFVLSLATGKFLGRALYGISATDPITYAGVFALLSGASLLACYLPARRAARINPMTALRIE